MVNKTNRLTLDPLVTVNKGNLILIKQIIGKIALDTNGNASYSDLMLLTNQSTTWTKLFIGSNWRLYFRAISGIHNHIASLTLSHTYSILGSYNISFVSTLMNATFQQMVTLKDCNVYFSN